MQSHDIFDQYEKTTWKINDLSWDSFDAAKVKPEYIKLARSAVMGECNSIAALHGFLNDAVGDYDFSAYASLWGYEELRHHYAFRAWLERVDGKYESLPVEATREPYPAGTTLAATLATNIISELTVCHVYKELSKQVEEPVLAEILAKASKDEARHASAFVHYTKRRLAEQPEELQSILEVLYVYMGHSGQEIKHPVSVFKGKEGEFANSETISDGFAYFLDQDDSRRHERLKEKVYATFSRVSNYELTSPSKVRRAIASEMQKHDRSVTAH